MAVGPNLLGFDFIKQVCAVYTDEILIIIEIIEKSTGYYECKK